MSEEQVLEMDAEVLETPEEISEDEDLLEFKADGEDSEIPDPTTKKTDEKPKGKGEPMMKMPSTKAGMINAMMGSMSKMNKTKLTAAYKKMNGMSEEAEVEEEMIEEKPLAQISASDIDVSDDVAAILNGSELDEEFQERVATIFEAAVVAKINEEIEKFAVEAEADVEVTNTQIVDELTEKVDSYLDYVVQEWVEDNKLAIEQGVRADMVEDFMRGLKDLFTEHYVDVPEEKIDVVEELFSKVEELEGKLNEETDKNVELTGIVKNFEKEALFAETTDGLTDTQTEKLRGLAEGIEFVSEEDFSKKISMLKAQYFDIDDAAVNTVVVDDEQEPVEIEEEKQGPTGAMANYMNAISRSAKK